METIVLFLGSRNFHKIIKQFPMEPPCQQNNKNKFDWYETPGVHHPALIDRANYH